MNILYKKLSLLFLLLFSITPPPAFAQLAFPKMFSSGMVLQRDYTIPVWGNAYPDSVVTVTIETMELSSQADAEGKWEISFPPMSAGGPFSMSVSSGTQTINISNVYIGDVWLAAGQSNMEMTVSNADSSASVIASANDQNIRQFKIPKGTADEPSDDLPAGSAWTPATSAYVGNFTAVGNYLIIIPASIILRRKLILKQYK